MARLDFLRISTICLLLTSQTAIGAPDMSKMDSFNAAPFGMTIDDNDPKTYGIKWAEPRKIRRVVVQFNENPPAPDAVEQYLRRAATLLMDPSQKTVVFRTLDEMSSDA